MQCLMPLAPQGCAHGRRVASHLDADEGHVLKLLAAQLVHRHAHARHAPPQQLQLRLCAHALRRKRAALTQQLTAPHTTQAAPGIIFGV